LTNRLNATPVARDMHLYSDSNCLEIYCWTQGVCWMCLRCFKRDAFSDAGTRRGF